MYVAVTSTTSVFAKALESIEVTNFPFKSHPLKVHPSLTGIYFVKSTVLNSVDSLINLKFALLPFIAPANGSSVK